MKLFIDENVPNEVIERLQQAGHSMRLVRDSHRGISDTAIFDIAEPDELIVTEDKGFTSAFLYENWWWVASCWCVC